MREEAAPEENGSIKRSEISDFDSDTSGEEMVEGKVRSADNDDDDDGDSSSGGEGLELGEEKPEMSESQSMPQMPKRSYNTQSI